MDGETRPTSGTIPSMGMNSSTEEGELFVWPGDEEQVTRQL